MWRYTHTDEMFVNNKNTLYHSDVYLGKDFSDGIRHWKYIKREKKNGKWIYYYNDDITTNINNEVTSATNEYNKSVKSYNKAKDAANKARYHFNSMGYMDDYRRDKEKSDKENKIHFWDSKATKFEKTFKAAKVNPILYNKSAEIDMHRKDSEASTAYSKMDKAKTKMDNAKAKQEKNNNTINKTRRKIAKHLVKTLNKASNAKEKGKRTLGKIFGK